MSPEAIERNPPMYVQIATRLRKRIISGELKDGDQLPADRAYAQELGVSRDVVVRAYRELAIEGLVKGEHGRGTFVTAGSVHRSGRDRFTQAHKTNRIYTDGEYARIRDSVLVPAPGFVADALGVEPGSQVIQRRRVTYGASGRPVSASTSYLRGELAEVAPDLLGTERLPQGTVGYVAEVTGRRASAWQDLVSARLATVEDAELLELSRPAAVKVEHCYLWDSDGATVEFGVSVSPEGTWSQYDGVMD